MADEKERMEQQAPGQEEPVLSPEEENPPPQETQAEEPDPGKPSWNGSGRRTGSWRNGTCG